MSDFTHLRLHSQYSIADGTIAPQQAVKLAAADGQKMLALTDLNNMFAAVRFYRAARSAGIKPILGAEAEVAYGEETEQELGRVVLLAMDGTGYRNLCELLSSAWTDSASTRTAAVSWQQLLAHSQGLILLAGGRAGHVGKALLRDDSRGAKRLAEALAQAFDGRFYFEIQRTGRADDDVLNQATLELAQSMDIAVVATHPVQFATAEDFEAHEARVCISDGDVLANPRRVRRFTEQQYFRTAAQMQELFADVPQALANTALVAQRCNVTLTLGKAHLPDYPIPPVDGRQLNEEEYLAHVCRQGLQQRMQMLYPDTALRTQKMPEYEARLEHEIKTIVQMGFCGYFLIVSDFIRWAKENGCPVGPGRGSGAGSLVAYVMYITDLDPLAYNLLFERFLNPERISMPDFDIDFCQSNRDRVIDYVKEKYGAQAVGQIATFGTMAPRAVVRDAGRVLEFSYKFCDEISKLIPNQQGKSYTLAIPPADETKRGKKLYALEEEPILARRERDEEQVATLLAMARKLEGTPRNIGMHAGGVLIAPGRLTDFTPLYCQPDSSSVVSQYDKDDVEAAGLVKFDFLGLATLTILEKARAFIRQRHASRRDFAFDQLTLDDKATYRLFAQGKTQAVFQFESPGMQKWLKLSMPNRFEDLIALNALYRPGPMDWIPDYVARKKGEQQVPSIDPRVDGMLSETYGVMVYQEQVMLTAQILGGYTLGGADVLRRAMGKKKVEEMERQRTVFREGAAANSIAADKADAIFDSMEAFAGYGFNKSHAAAYALLAYYTGWVKTHYPAEFFAANMTVEMDSSDKLHAMHTDAVSMGVAFALPDINHSVYEFMPVDRQTDTTAASSNDRRTGKSNGKSSGNGNSSGNGSNKTYRGTVAWGLGAIKGTGEAAIASIVQERETGGAFTSLFDFYCRVDKGKINKRTVEALIKSGAFDRLEPDRAALLASIELAAQFAVTQEANANQGGLFDFDDSEHASDQEPPLATAAAFTLPQQLAEEKSVLGMHLSAHLFDDTEAEMRQCVPLRIADAQESREPVRLTGVLSTDLRRREWKSGRGVRISGTLDDGTGSMELQLDEDMLAAHDAASPHPNADTFTSSEPRGGDVLVIQGAIRYDQFLETLVCRVERFWTLEQARCQFGRYLRISLPASADTATLDGIHRIVQQHPAQNIQNRLDPEQTHRYALGVRADITGETVSGSLRLGEKAQFYPSQEALQAWNTLGNDITATVVYQTA